MPGPKTQAVLDKLVVPQHKGEEEVWQNSRWLNRDTVPLPPSRRTWGPWAYVGFWITTGVNISGWTGGSALLSLGLSVQQAMICAVIGQFLVAGCVVLTGLFGAKWHVGFPMWNRVVWGMRASYFPLANRIVLSFTWCATQAWFGGQVMKTLLGSMFPSIYRMKNVFPESTAMESADFLCFILFLLVSLPLIMVPPEHYRKPFLFTAVTSTITCFSIFIWSLARAGGGGPFINESVEAITGVPPVKGAYLVWAIFYGISSQMGQIVAGILNMSDYTRFASKPKDQVLSQVIVVPVMGVMTTVIGIICTSVAAQFYPERGLLWEPYTLLRAIQEESGSAGARAAVFFASFAFLIAQFGINIAGNAVSGGIDSSSMFPKYINIRRGAYITTAMALPMCPWALLSGATVFISVMGGYATFLAPMCGLMVTDYLFVRKGNVKLTSLYICAPTSVYFYWKGVNWRAPLAWVCGVAPLFPGFLSTVSTVSLPLGLTRVYYLCFPLGFFLSGTIYFTLCKIFPLERVDEKDEHDYFGTFGEPYLERNDPDADCIKEALHKVHSKEDTVGEIGVFPVRE